MPPKPSTPLSVATAALGAVLAWQFLGADAAASGAATAAPRPWRRYFGAGLLLLGAVCALCASGHAGTAAVEQQLPFDYVVFLVRGLGRPAALSFAEQLSLDVLVKLGTEWHRWACAHHAPPAPPSLPALHQELARAYRAELNTSGGWSLTERGAERFQLAVNIDYHEAVGFGGAGVNHSHASEALRPLLQRINESGLARVLEESKGQGSSRMEWKTVHNDTAVVKRLDIVFVVQGDSMDFFIGMQKLQCTFPEAPPRPERPPEEPCSVPTRAPGTYATLEDDFALLDYQECRARNRAARAEYRERLREWTALLTTRPERRRTALTVDLEQFLRYRFLRAVKERYPIGE